MKIFFFAILSTLTFADLDKSYNGFGLDIGESGSGIFITRQGFYESGNFSLNGELRFYDIKASNETIVYDPFSGQYQSVGGKNLFMVPLFIGGNYYLFNGKIENNFSPFITCRVGGVLSVDGEEVGNIKEKWGNPDTQITPGGFFGFGIDFQMVGQTLISTMIGFEILPLYRDFDGLDNYSGLLIHISFNRRSK